MQEHLGHSVRLRGPVVDQNIPWIDFASGLCVSLSVDGVVCMLQSSVSMTWLSPAPGTLTSFQVQLSRRTFNRSVSWSCASRLHCNLISYPAQP